MFAYEYSLQQKCSELFFDWSSENQKPVSSSVRRFLLKWIYKLNGALMLAKSRVLATVKKDKMEAMNEVCLKVVRK